MLVGTANGASTVSVEYRADDGKTYTDSVAVSEDGTYSLELSHPLNDEETNIKITSQDANGNSSDALFTEVTVDITAPGKPTLDTMISNNEGIDEGSNSNKDNNHVKDDKPTLNGTASEGSSTVTIAYTGKDGLKYEQTVDVADDGTYSITLDNALREGETAVVMTSSDAFGNVSNELVSVVNVRLMQGIVSSKNGDISVFAVASEDATQSPYSNTRFVSDTQPNINGKAVGADVSSTNHEGKEVQISYTDKDNIERTEITTMNEDGTYSLDLGYELPEGDNVITVTALNGEGTEDDEVNELTLTVDTTTPDAPTVGSINTDVVTYVRETEGTDIVELVQSDAKTEVNVLLSSDALPGDIITLYVDGIEVGTARVTAESLVKSPPSVDILIDDMTEGTHKLTTTSTDSAGNVSDKSDESSVTITDSIVETTSSVDDNDATPTLTGTAQANSTVSVTYKVGINTYTETTKTDENGNYSIELSNPMYDGANNIKINCVNDNGTVSETVETNIDVDTGESISSPTLIGLADSSLDQTKGEDITNSYVADTTPSLMGIAQADSIVSITYTAKDGETYTETTTANGDGAYMISLSNELGEHKTNVSITSTKDGETSKATIATITVDTKAPATPTVMTVEENFSAKDNYTGAQLSNEYIADSTPTFTGEGEPGTTISIEYVGNDNVTYTDTAIVDENGKYSIVISHALADDTISENQNVELNIYSTDQAGNKSEILTKNMIVQSAIASSNASSDSSENNKSTNNDRSVKTEERSTNNERSAKTDDRSAKTDEGNDDSSSSEEETEVISTNSYNPTITGTIATALSVMITYSAADGKIYSQSVDVDENGNYSITLNEKLPDGDTSIDISYKDDSGTSKHYESKTITVDVAAPDKPTVDPLGSLAEGSTVTLTGTAEAGSTLSVSYDGNVETTTVNEDGTYSITLKETLSYSTTFTITATDDAGNVSEALLVSATVNEDIVLLDVPITDFDISNDTGDDTDFITTEHSQEITATLGRSLTTGEFLKISMDGGEHWLDITSSVNGTKVAWPIEFNEGTHTIMMRVEDECGEYNEYHEMSQSYILDGAVGSNSISDITISNDDGNSDSDSVTSIKTQTITAELENNLGHDQLWARVTTEGSAQWVNITAYVNETDISWPNVDLVPGTNNIQFQVRDTSGNKGPVFTKEYTYNDPINKVAELQVDTAGGTGTTYDNITNNGRVNIKDTNDGDVLHYRVDGGEWIAVNGNGFTLSEGSHKNVSIRVSDENGNASVTNLGKIIVDQTADDFEISIDNLAGDAVSQNKVEGTPESTTDNTISVTGIEPTSIWYYMLNNDGILHEGGKGNGVLTLVDGYYHDITFSTKDVAGNLSAGKSIGKWNILTKGDASNVYLDNDTQGGKGTYTDNISKSGLLHINGLDETTTWEYKVGDGEYVQGTGSTLTLSEGVYKNFTVKTTDANGNEHVNNLGKIVVDHTPDDGKIKMVDYYSCNWPWADRIDGKEITMTGLDDTTAWYLQLDGGEWVLGGYGSSSSYVIHDGVYEKGQYKVKTIDKAGNESKVQDLEGFVAGDDNFAVTNWGDDCDRISGYSGWGWTNVRIEAIYEGKMNYNEENRHQVIDQCHFSIYGGWSAQLPDLSGAGTGMWTIKVTGYGSGMYSTFEQQVPGTGPEYENDEDNAKGNTEAVSTIYDNIIIEKDSDDTNDNNSGKTDANNENAYKPTIQGNALANGVVTFTYTSADGVVRTQQSKVNSEGVYEITIAYSLNEGDTSIAVTAVDKFGSAYPIDDIVTTVDTSGPDAPTLDDLPNPLPTDGMLTLTGTAEANSILTVTYNGNEESVQVDADGNYTISLEHAVKDSTVLKLTATDGSGNESEALISSVNISDNIVLLDVSITDFDISNDTGDDTDFITTEHSQEITATLGRSLTTGEFLKISMDGGEHWLDITSSVNGTKVAWPIEFNEGTHTIMMRVEDECGEYNEYHEMSQSYILDGAVGSNSISDITISNDDGNSDSDSVTSIKTQTITAELENNLGHDQLWARVTTEGSAQWVNITAYVNETDISWPNVDLVPGTNNIQFQVRDTSGNKGPVFTKEYTYNDPINKVAELQVDTAGGTGTTYDNITNNGRVNIKDTNDGDVLHYRVDGGEWIAVNGNGFTLSEGSHKNVSIRVSDENGNASVTNLGKIIVDQTADDFEISIDNLAGDAVSQNKVEGTPESTTDNTISVTGIEPTSIWYYMLNNDGILHEGGKGNGVLTLVDGYYHDITFSTKDVAGNLSAGKSIGKWNILTKGDASNVYLDNDTQGGKGTYTDNISKSGLLHINGLDETTTWEYKVGDGEYVQGTGSTLTLSEGVYKNFTVKTTDANGNEHVNNLGKIVVDHTPDDGKIKMVDYYSCNWPWADRIDGKEITMTGLDDTTAWYLQLDGGEWVLGGYGSSSSYVIHDGVYEKGQYKVKTIDKAGNESKVQDLEGFVAGDDNFAVTNWGDDCDRISGYSGWGWTNVRIEAIYEGKMNYNEENRHQVIDQCHFSIYGGWSAQLPDLSGAGTGMWTIKVTGYGSGMYTTYEKQVPGTGPEYENGEDRNNTDSSTATATTATASKSSQDEETKSDDTSSTKKTSSENTGNEQSETKSEENEESSSSNDKTRNNTSNNSTLVLDSSSTDINFDDLAAAQENDINVIDASNGDFTIREVSLEDVLDMTDESNDLIFVGDNGDTIDLANNDEWTRSDEKVTLENKEGEFFEYVSTKDPTAKLFIDEDIDII